MTGDCVRGEDGSPAKKEELSHGTGSCVGCESGTLSTKDELCRATCGGVCDEGGRVDASLAHRLRRTSCAMRQVVAHVTKVVVRSDSERRN